MRVTLRQAALLALPTLSNAVSLADMTPRATNLPPMCEAVYTSQIYGCSPQDFQSQQCSSTCVSALYGLEQAIYHACAGQTGQNLVVAFLAGVGPQQLCHNAGDSTGLPSPPTTATQQPPQTHWSPTIGSSTTTARTPTDTGSLLVDTSSTMTATLIPPKTTTTTSSSASSELAETTTKTTAAPDHTTHAQSPAAGTTTSSAAPNSQSSLNDHSGGGSPFDTTMNAASSVTLSFGVTILSAAAAMLLALR